MAAAGLAGAVVAMSVAAATEWQVCDVTSARFGAVGDGVSIDTASIRAALTTCNEIVLPAGRVFASGPLNLSSNQIFRVDGTLIASDDPNDYPVVLPVIGYGWSHDQNCFPVDATRNKVVEGALRYAPIIGVYNARNVSITGSGLIDGNGNSWWDNCTRCHYPPNNDSSLCLIASRPKLIEAQFVDGLKVFGSSPGLRTSNGASTTSTLGSRGVLTLKDSPFWTVTPSYSQNIHVSDLRILAPMDRIGNTDGVNIDSCRNVSQKLPNDIPQKKHLIELPTQSIYSGPIEVLPYTVLGLLAPDIVALSLKITVTGW